MEDQQSKGLLGAGGQAREVESYLKDSTVSFWAVDPDYIAGELTIDVTSPSDSERDTPVIAAIGAPAPRKSMVEKWPGRRFFTVISENAYVDKSAKIGEGSIIAPNTTITTDIVIGAHSIINVGATINHNCTFGDYVTVSPGAHIAGNVTLGDGVFIGIGATISNDVSIAEGCVVGAGAVVINDVEQINSVVVGVPAKTISINEGWLHEV